MIVYDLLPEGPNKGMAAHFAIGKAMAWLQRVLKCCWLAISQCVQHVTYDALVRNDRYPTLWPANDDNPPQAMFHVHLCC